MNQQDLIAPKGGATPIADSRAVYRALDPALIARFEKRELLYVRNFGQGLDLPWQQSFGTDEPAEVERMCAARGLCWSSERASCRMARVRRQTVRHFQGCVRLDREVPPWPFSPRRD